MRARKGWGYDGGHRVPFLVQWPAADIGGGRDIDRLATGVDVAPTLVELAGLELPKPIEFHGRSRAPLLRDEPGWAGGRVHFTQHSKCSIDGKHRINDPQPYLKSAVADERWRFVDGKELYDSKADPAHADDFAADHPERVTRPRAFYDEWRAQVSGPAHEYCEFPIEAEGGNPTRPTSSDCRPDEGPANHAVMQHPERFREYDGDGFWAVRVAESGKDAFTLMERRPEADYPFEAVEARIKIVSIEAGQSTPSGARSVSCETKLEASPSELWTWCDHADGTTRGRTSSTWRDYALDGPQPQASQISGDTVGAHIQS